MDVKETSEGTSWVNEAMEYIENPPLATEKRISKENSNAVALPILPKNDDGFRRRKASSLHLFVAAMVDIVCDCLPNGASCRTALCQILVASGWVPAIYLSESYHALRNSIKNTLNSCLPMIAEVAPVIDKTLLGREMRFSPFATSRYNSDFEELELIGKGGFGKVFVVRSRIDDCKYAVKKISFTFQQNEPMIKAISEVRMLASLKHKNIVRYYSAWAELAPGREEIQQQLRIREMRLSESTDEKASEGSTSAEVGKLGNGDSTLDASSSSWIVTPNKKQEGGTKGRFWLNNKDDSDSTTESTESDSDPNGDCSNSAQPKISEATTSSDSDFSFSSVSSACVPYRQKSSSRFKATMYVQMELCTQTLDDYLQKRNSVPTVVVDRQFNENIVKQLADALSYIHNKNIIHRDVKPCNLFLTERGSRLPRLLLGDFGLACREDGTRTVPKSEGFESDEWNEPYHSANVGTAVYSAPEQSSREYDTSVDVFSAGIVTFELYSPSSTTMERNQKIMFLRKGQLDPKFRDEWPLEAKLVAEMCSLDPSKRPRAFEVTTGLELIEQRTVGMLVKEIAQRDEIIKAQKEEIFKLKEEVKRLQSDLKF